MSTLKELKGLAVKERIGDPTADIGAGSISGTPLQGSFANIGRSISEGSSLIVGGTSGNLKSTGGLLMPLIRTAPQGPSWALKRRTGVTAAPRKVNPREAGVSFPGETHSRRVNSAEAVVAAVAASNGQPGFAPRV
eukprot:1178480-Prorocentrum_minimum.AAC.5